MMMTIWRQARGLCLALLLFCIWMPSASALGEGITPVLTQEDSGNGYLFQVDGVGGFTTNVTLGETSNLAVIEIYDDLYVEVFLNGQQIDFGYGTFFDNGSYELYIYTNELKLGEYGLFTFSILNDYQDLLGMDTELTVEEYPEMALSYDQEAGAFVYTLDTGDYIKSNVPQGGYLNGGAEISISDGIFISAVYLDGARLYDYTSMKFSVRGNYEIHCMVNPYGFDGDVSYTIVFSFTLAADTISGPRIVPSPMGFSLIAMSCNGVAQQVLDEDFAYLGQDGLYTLYYETEDGLYYNRTLMLDTTPPSLNFNVPMDGGTVSEAVTFDSPDPDVAMTVYRNGVVITATNNTLSADSGYAIFLEDGLGNEREYQFRVEAEEAPWTVYLWVFPALLGAGVLIALVRKLGHFLQVR